MAAPSILRLVLRRSLAGKGFLAVVALGVFVAATLLASAPIYGRAMADEGLTFTVRQELSSQPSTRIEFSRVPLKTTAGQGLQSAIEQRIDERLGWFRSSQAKFIRLGRFGVAKSGEPPRTGLVQAQPQSLPGFEAHVRLIDGQMPAATRPGEPIELALSPQAATVANLKPGDLFDLQEGFDTCERKLPVGDPPPPPPPCDSTAAAYFSLPAKVSGIVEPLDPEDPFWVSPVSAYFDPFRLDIPDVGPIIPMFADEHTITDNFGAQYPAYPVSIAWHVFADPEKLNRANFELARADIDGLYSDLAPLGGVAFSPLRDTLGRFGQSADQKEIPLTVLLLEISAIALFYVGLVSAIVVERQSDEIALLRSRGASMSQIASLYLSQGLLIGIPAILLAPFFAAATTALLGLTPTFHAVTGGSLLPVTIPPLSFAAAAAGVGLSLLAVLVPALLVARRSTTAQRRIESRPGRSVIHRYYLDIALAGVAGLVLFELRQRGSAFEPSSTGGLSSDPLILASPALIIAAAAALVLRFYPLILRLVANLLTAAAGASVSLGLTQVVRNSAQYTRLTLLLMMAVAVGSFAASYASTTDRSYSDRAAYETGADIRATGRGDARLPAPANGLDAKLGAIPGVEGASGVTRSLAGFASPGVITQGYQAIGVDPDAMSQMLWWRGDFADRPLPDLMRAIEAPPATPGRALPGEPETLKVWVKGDETMQALTLWARFRDSDGIYATVELGKPDTGNQWAQLSTSLSENFRGDLKFPLSLVSILMTEGVSRFNSNYTPLLLDDMTITSRDGATTTVEDFEGGLRWGAFASRTAEQDAFTLSKDDHHGGSAAGRFTFHPGKVSDTRGIYTTSQILPLAVLASESFLNTTGMRRGSSTTLLVGRSTLVPVTIAGSFELFPTVNSADGPALVFNRDQLTTWNETAAFSEQPDLVPKETLLTLKPGADEPAVLTALKSPEFGIGNTSSRAEALDANRRNPLIAAGGSGILLISFVAVLVLVTAALLVSLLTSLKRRRVEFAVVRSMGISNGQIFRMLALEYSVVAAAGTAVGAVLGLLVGRQMLSFLNVTESGAKVEPGFILQTQWVLVAGAVGVVLLVFAIALIVATRIIASIADAQALRTE